MFAALFSEGSRPSRRRPRLRPQLVWLEDRALPSTFTVMNLNDSGPGSLRAALASGDDTVAFAKGLHGTIALTSGELLIASSVTINGPGANKLTVSGNNASRVFSVSGAATHVAIDGLTIANGLATDLAFSTPLGPLTAGGGILNNGAHLALDHVTLVGNQVVTTGDTNSAAGGAVANLFGATFSADDTAFLGNRPARTSRRTPAPCTTTST